VDGSKARRDQKAGCHSRTQLDSILPSVEGSDELVFFGGTALSRTSLPNLRLSEDIDLITKTNRSQMAARIMEALYNSLARTHGQVTWNKALNATKGSEPSVLRVGETGVQIQLLSADGYPNWPTEISDLEQRYSDAPAARLTVLTQASFVAAKTAAWMDRSCPQTYPCRGRPTCRNAKQEMTRGARCCTRRRCGRPPRERVPSL